MNAIGSLAATGWFYFSARELLKNDVMLHEYYLLFGAKVRDF